MADIRAEYINFIGGIVEGGTPEATPEQREALLHWLVRRGNASAEAVATAFEFHNMPGDTARRRVMVYLDATLFARDQDPYRLFGLTPECTFDAIRTRHKQLMQVLHPDRHDDHQEWFTERSERINHAYADLKAHHGQPWHQRRSSTVTPSAPGPRRQPVQKASAPAGWQTLFADPNRLRRRLRTRLGNAASLEKRVYIILVAVPVILLIVVYVHQGGFNDPTEQVVVIDATRDAGDREGAALREYQHPDARIETSTAAGRAAPHPRSEPDPAAAIRLQPAPVPPDSVHDYPVPAETLGESGYRIVVATLAGFPFATVNVDPEPAPTGSADIPVATAPGDIELYPESRAPAIVTAVDTGETVVARPTRAVDADDQAGEGARAEAASDQVGQSQPQAPANSTAGQAEAQTAGAAAEQAAAEQAAAEQAAAEQAAAEQAAAEQAAAEQAAAEQAAAEQAAAEQAAAEQAAAEQAAAEQAAAEQAAAEQAAAEQAAAEQAAAEQAAAEQAAAEQAAAEQAAAKQAAAKQAAAEQAAAEQAAAEQPPGLPAVRELLDQYQLAYNHSDIERFRRLFNRNAVSKNADSREEIAEQYQSLFNRTRERTLVLRNVRIEQAGDQAYRVRTHYAVQWTYPDGETKTDSGQFQMLLTQTGRTMRIQRLDYE